ncbi:MAG: hypothetical protein K5872_18300 [Rhizobiaceae bacterium]|nr:hypothetical protein [Rhizobiaceae bacterium]MCV0408177.1 hypothetical protein [Rhizobiaceae bacterium]
MVEALGEARWEAIRAISEGEPPTRERVAVACGVYVKTLSRRATAEGWQALDFRFPRVRLAHREMIALARLAAEGEALDPVEEEDEGEGEDGDDGTRADEPSAREEAAEALAPFSDMPPSRQLAQLRAMLTRRSAELLHRAKGGRPLENRQVTALANMVSLTERIAALAAAEKEEEARGHDRKVGDMLELLNQRILYLGTALAHQLLVETGMSAEEADAALGERARYRHPPEDRAREVGG